MTLLDLLRVVGVVAGLVLPGWGWARSGNWPLPALAAGLISTLAIFAGVFALSVVAVPVTGGSLTLWLLACGLPGWWHAWRRGSLSLPTIDKERWRDCWLAWPVLLLVAVAGWRAFLQPMSGPDTSFRWNLLAQLIVERGGLAGYPPVTTADFTDYFWADGIAPFVAAVHAWCYLAGGTTALEWTAPAMLLQTAVMLALIFALGASWASASRGGWFALALAAGTMLLQFAMNLGQETGFTAIGCGGMVFYLSRSDEGGRAPCWIPAALSAAVVGCAREYGVVAGLLGALWLFGRGERRQAAGFLVLAWLLPAAWHGYVWRVTGNPLFAHDVIGFPVPVVFAACMEHYREIYGDQLRHAGTWREIGRLVLVAALPATAGLLAGACSFWRRPGAGLVLASAGAFVAVWFVSVPSTAGGLFYSMRVLSPVLLLGCAWGGAVLARWIPERRHLVGVSVALALFAADASLRAWTIPLNPYTLTPREWPAAGYWLHDEFDREHRAFLEEVARTCEGRVLSDSAGLRGFFAEHGKTYSPFWSPDVAWLFPGHDQATVPSAGARLRELGFSHLLLKRSAITTDFLTKTGARSALVGQLRAVAANDTFILWELAPPAASAAGGGSGD